MILFERYFEAFVYPALQATALKNTSTLLAALSAQECAQLENTLAEEPALAAPLIRCLIGSEYLLESCCRDPSLLLCWLLTEAAHSSLSAACMNELMASAVGEHQSVESLDISLRDFRRRVMLAIIWRDLMATAG